MIRLNKRKRIGYEVSVEVPGDELHIFCVDDKKKIRGFYVDGFRHYMSNWDLWQDHKGLGRMEGDFKRGGRVSAYKEDGNIFDDYGYKLYNLRVRDVREVDIARMTSDPYEAGLDRPIWRPGSLN